MNNFSNNKTDRKVRFNLPDIAPQLENRKKLTRKKEHGTISYVNGTLINAKIRIPAQKQISEIVTVTRIVKPIPVLSLPSKSFHTVVPSTTVPSPKPFDVNSNYYLKGSGQGGEGVNYKNTMANCVKRTEIIKRPSSNVDLESGISYHKTIDALKAKHVVILNSPPPVTDLKPVKMYDCQAICDKFSRFRLFEDILARKRKYHKDLPIKNVRHKSLSSEDLNHNNSTISTITTAATTLERIEKNLISEENHNGIIYDLIYKLKRHRNRWEKYENEIGTGYNNDHSSIIYNNVSTINKDPLETLTFKKRFKTDVRSLGCLKMSLTKDPPVTTLLRAARDGDEDLLKIVFRKILIDGISKEALNATDKSGRTAISYVCSTSLTNFLDIMLQLPGIDLNKADNEGNTPLHFAAQAGQSEVVNMMLTRCRNLQVDPKNCLGFTPLMKAALQGRTRCAKLLLFAGASSEETDKGRKLNAAEWARFCGRETCAEMLEKCARVRQLEKSNSVRTTTKPQTKFAIMRSKTNPIHPEIGESFRSRFKKFLSINSNSQKDKDSTQKKKNKSKNKNSENKSDLMNYYLTNSTFCSNGGATTTHLSSEHKKRMTATTTTTIRPLEVPKLEITPANNQHLIQKYEEKIKREKSSSSIVNVSHRVSIRN